jgi:hypothetical protein
MKLFKYTMRLKQLLDKVAPVAQVIFTVCCFINYAGLGFYLSGSKGTLAMDDTDIGC